MAYTQNINEVNAVAALVNALVVGGYGNVAAGADASANFWIYEAVQNLATFVPASVSAALTPTALATGPSLAEQTYNPAGFASLKAGDTVIVNPPGAQTAATSIAAVRVTAAGTLGITWLATAGTPTPAAGTYVVRILRS